jgi:WD40 repeat protein
MNKFSYMTLRSNISRFTRGRHFCQKRDLWCFVARGLHGNRCDELVDVFLESSPINCLSVQPQENSIFISATEDGHVHLYDLRSASSDHDRPSIVIAESADGSYHSCAFHPQQTCLVATANARQGIELYDIRLSKR